MSYAELSADFRKLKQDIPINLHQSTAWWDERAKASTFSFLATNRSLIEHEFQDLFAVLKQHDQEILLIDQQLAQLTQQPDNDEKRRAYTERKEMLKNWAIERKNFWIHCYYYARLLESYNNAYGKQNSYGQWCEEIKMRIENPSLVPLAEKKAWMQKILDDLQALASTPWHIGKIRDWISFANVYRIHTVFCRLAAKGFLTVASEQKLLDGLKDVLGWNVNISTLDAPTNVYNALSVGLFAARFIINLGLMAKHVFAPSEKELDGDAHWYDHAYERFLFELNKRYCSMLNDVVWAGVNGASNYAAYFNLSSGFANWLTAGFLCFDVALLYWRRGLEQQDYLIKKHQYLQELGVDDVTELRGELTLEQKMLVDALKQLEICWDAKNAMYWFDIAAAGVLVASLTTAILIASPAIVTPLCFFMITIGASMYITDGQFLAYQEKRYALKHMSLDEYSAPLYHTSLNESWNKFLMSFLKNATIPLFITAAFTVSTPAALLLAGLYLAYENGKNYVERPEPLVASLLITGACFISWPIALTMTAIYLSYEAVNALLPESASSNALPRP